MDNKKKNIAETVRDIVTPVADELGYTVWDVEYVKEGADMILRITIDSENGIDIDDCEKMSRAIDPLIDEADPIDVSYRMEVSSPGVERVLTRPEHFEACKGEKVEIRLFAPVDGQKQFVGILGDCTADSLTLMIDGNEKAFDRQTVSKVSTVFDW